MPLWWKSTRQYRSRAPLNRHAKKNNERSYLAQSSINENAQENVLPPNHLQRKNSPSPRNMGKNRNQRNISRFYSVAFFFFFVALTVLLPSFMLLILFCCFPIVVDSNVLHFYRRKSLHAVHYHSFCCVAPLFSSILMCCVSILVDATAFHPRGDTVARRIKRSHTLSGA